MSSLLASDNYSTAHPLILEAVNKTNYGYQKSYGSDTESDILNDNIKDIFGAKAIIIPTLTGTGSNIISLSSLSDGFKSVIALNLSHINVDEGGAPEAAGIKILPIEHRLGKLEHSDINTYINYQKDQHRSQPGIISITQPSEFGRVYSLNELADIIEVAKKNNLKTHLDGARLTNAAVSLGVNLKSLTYDLGFDAISFGATKNGAILAESVITFDGELAQKIVYIRKQRMQLASKLRFISSQFNAYFKDDLYLSLASKANQAAITLKEELMPFAKLIKIKYPIEANSIFANLPSNLYATLPDKLGFYQWDDADNLVRLMTSWSTTSEEIKDFTALLSRSI
jgi:threonine aldolase